MKTILDGHDVFVWLPTGYSKSLYHHALPFHMVFKLDLVNIVKTNAVSFRYKPISSSHNGLNETQPILIVIDLVLSNNWL